MSRSIALRCRADKSRCGIEIFCMHDKIPNSKPSGWRVGGWVGGSVSCSDEKPRWRNTGSGEGCCVNARSQHIVFVVAGRIVLTHRRAVVVILVWICACSRNCFKHTHKHIFTAQLPKQTSGSSRAHQHQRQWTPLDWLVVGRLRSLGRHLYTAPVRQCMGEIANEKLSFPAVCLCVCVSACLGVFSGCSAGPVGLCIPVSKQRPFVPFVSRARTTFFTVGVCVALVRYPLLALLLLVPGASGVAFWGYLPYIVCIEGCAKPSGRRKRNNLNQNAVPCCCPACESCREHGSGVDNPLWKCLTRSKKTVTTCKIAQGRNHHYRRVCVWKKKCSLLLVERNPRGSGCQMWCAQVVLFFFSVWI